MKEVKEELKVIKEGVMDIGGFKMRCYVCNDGKRYFNADDIAAFFDELGNGLELSEENAMDVARFIHGVDSPREG